jgi:hypothetical protein
MALNLIVLTAGAAVVKRQIASTISFLLFVTLAVPAQCAVLPWKQMVRTKYPALLHCGVPSELSSSKSATRPDGFTLIVASLSDRLASDGCTVLLLTNGQANQVVLFVSGGFSGDIRFYLGPSRADGTDL